MNDPQLDKLADVLVNYSTAVRPGDLVRLAGPPVARPLVVALYRAVLKAGGHPHLTITPDECEEIKLELASEEQLRYQDPLDLFTVERIDVMIRVRAEDNTKSLSGTDPRRQALLSQARKEPMARFLARAATGELRWVSTQFPCHASAQDAQMSLDAYERFVFDAGLLGLDDPAAAWRELSRRQQHLTDYLNGSKEIRFTTPEGTDLTLGVEGRKWINCDGEANFPDGEVFTGPVEDATQGVVCYSFPAVHGGREVDGIRLEFKDGRVVDASAARGEEFLLAMLDQDAGARTLGKSPWAPITPSGSTPRTRSSTKRSAARSTPPWAPPIRRPAPRTSRVSTGTWSATSAPAEKSSSTASSSARTAASSIPHGPSREPVRTHCPPATPVSKSNLSRALFWGGRGSRSTIRLARRGLATAVTFWAGKGLMPH